MPVRVTRHTRRFGLFLRAARAGGVSRDVFQRCGLELGFTPGAAEQHLLAVMREPMRRSGFDNHAANWVAQINADMSVVSVMMMAVSVHGFFASYSRS